MGEEKRQASDRPQRGRGRPAGCREGFEGGSTTQSISTKNYSKTYSTDRTFGAKRRVWIPRKKRVCAHVLAHHPRPFAGGVRGCLTLPSEGHLRARPVGEEKRQASDRPQRGCGRPAGCREGFEGGSTTQSISTKNYSKTYSTDRTFGAKRRVWIPRKTKLVCAHVLAHHPRSGASVPCEPRPERRPCHNIFTGTGSAKQGCGEGWETALSTDLKNDVHLALPG